MASTVAVMDVAWPLLLLGVAWIASLGVLTLLLLGRRRRLGRNEDRRFTVLLVALVVLFGAFGYGFVVLYVTQYVPANTWSFEYSLSVQGNATGPDSVIMPVVRDATLLDGLHLVSGQANWSLVTTSKGPGLYLRFTGSATITVRVSRFPMPAPLPDTTPTLAEASNGTAYPVPQVWIYYLGTAGGSFSLSIGDWYTHGYLEPGWTLDPFVGRAIQ